MRSLFPCLTLAICLSLLGAGEAAAVLNPGDTRVPDQNAFGGAQTTVSSGGSFVAPTGPVDPPAPGPYPGLIALLGLGLALWGVRGWRQHRARPSSRA